MLAFGGERKECYVLVAGVADDEPDVVRRGEGDTFCYI